MTIHDWIYGAGKHSAWHYLKVTVITASFAVMPALAFLHYFSWTFGLLPFILFLLYFVLRTSIYLICLGFFGTTPAGVWKHLTRRS